MGFIVVQNTKWGPNKWVRLTDFFQLVHEKQLEGLKMFPFITWKTRGGWNYSLKIINGEGPLTYIRHLRVANGIWNTYNLWLPKFFRIFLLHVKNSRMIRDHVITKNICIRTIFTLLTPFQWLSNKKIESSLEVYWFLIPWTWKKVLLANGICIRISKKIEWKI